MEVLAFLFVLAFFLLAWLVLWVAVSFVIAFWSFVIAFWPLILIVAVVCYLLRRSSG